MSRTLVLAGLLIDSWRDQPPRTEPTEINLPGGTIPVSRLRGISKEPVPAPRLTSLWVQGATECDPRGE